MVDVFYFLIYFNFLSGSFGVSVGFVRGGGPGGFLPGTLSRRTTSFYWVLLPFLVNSFCLFCSSILWDLNIHEIHTAASRSPVVHRDFKFDRGESLN